MVKQPSFVFKKYYPVNFQDDIYITPFLNDPIIKRKDIKKSDFIIYTDASLFISLINLLIEVQKLLDEQKTNDSISLVIEWCAKYGLPYEDETFSNEYGGNLSGAYVGFSVTDFLCKIRILYECFLLWLTILNQDSKLIQNNLKILKLSSNKSTENMKIEIMEFLAEFIPENIGFVTLNLTYDVKKNKFKLIPYKGDKNLLSVAYHQLLLLMIGEQNNIKFCSKCLMVFQPTHGNQDFCLACNRDYHRDFMRIKRQKKSDNIKST